MAQMIGHAYAAGNRHGVVRIKSSEIAKSFFRRPEVFEGALERLETHHHPGIILLQNPLPGAKVGGVAFYSSVWSKSYAVVGTPYGKVHRDFHYQCLFAAFSALVEIGCIQIRVEHPMSEYRWRRDAYICLLEAVRNIQKYMNPTARVHLERGSYSERMVEHLDRRESNFDMQDHRPVGINMYIFEGLNMRTVFVEKADDALNASSGRPPLTA
jgi:hypothetical protein